MEVWRVAITLDDGSAYEDYVIARTAADAGLVLGDRIRAERRIARGDMLGARDIAISRAPERFRACAIN